MANCAHCNKQFTCGCQKASLGSGVIVCKQCKAKADADVYGAHRTTAALEKVPQASRDQCEANATLIKAWQPKASTLCIEGLGSL